MIRVTRAAPGFAHATSPVKGTSTDGTCIVPDTLDPGGRTRRISVQKPPAPTSTVNDTPRSSVTFNRRRTRCA
jgi:hypothetical protein